jgi:hypothetical protein
MSDDEIKEESHEDTPLAVDIEDVLGEEVAVDPIDEEAVEKLPTEEDDDGLDLVDTAFEDMESAY